MEAVPRLPMISFELLTTGEKVSFGSKLKPYIASFYQEDPESYNNEIHNLEGLRASAVWPSIDINNCQIMKKYFCQLHFLKSRFPMEEGQVSAVYFSWRDDYTKMSCSVPDISFELMCILINIGAIHTKLGAADSRNTSEGMKMSCTHFQCAAWAFQSVREIYGVLVGLVMISSEQIRGMYLVCLAQAQECILEKSLLDNRKATIIAKIAVQLSDYYRQALVSFTSGEEGLVCDHLPNNKYIIQYLTFKVSYHRCIALLYQGQQAEEQQKMGERVAFYAAALEALQEAIKSVSKSSNQALFKDTIAFTLDVVEGKRKAATNENEFIYHEDVPQLDSLQEIKGASLVKGIPFNVNDTEVSGPDIFGRLVPMEAHEASSLYSEQKAQLLRQIGERVEKRDQELNEFMSSLQVDVLAQMKSAKGLTQDLVDRAAELIAKPNATKDLIDAMGKLSNSYQEVEAMLKEIQELLKREEELEKDYQTIMGKRPPSIIATDLSRESAKYQEAHGRASESNQNLHKAMTTHVANLKILAQPINQLVLHIPSLQLPDPKVDEKIVNEMDMLVAKIDEMKKQRVNLWTKLRDAIHQDDITGPLVTRQPNQPLDKFFKIELEKHNNTTMLIEKNMEAQDNICKAIVEKYALFTPTRKYIQDVIFKRNNTINALNASYDTYDDLLAKANKGIEFYAKLETNVSKLQQRIKSACKVQEEEREQILMKNGHVSVPKQQIEPELQNNKPKLKDYLDSMKEKRDAVIGPTMQYPTSSMYPTQPEASNWNENNTNAHYTPSQIGYAQATQNYNNSVNTSNFGSHGYTQVNYSDKNMDQMLDRMNAIKIPSSQYDYTNSQAYNYPVSYTPTTTYTLTSTNLPMCVSPQVNASSYSNPPSAYQTVSSTNYPYITASEQYNLPDDSQKVNGTNVSVYGTYTSTTTTPTVSSGIYYNQQGPYYNYTSATTSQAYPYQYYGNDYNQYPSGTQTTQANMFPQNNPTQVSASQYPQSNNVQYPQSNTSQVTTTQANIQYPPSNSQNYNAPVDANLYNNTQPQNNTLPYNSATTQDVYNSQYSAAVGAYQYDTNIPTTSFNQSNNYAATNYNQYPGYDSNNQYNGTANYQAYPTANNPTTGYSNAAYPLTSTPSNTAISNTTSVNAAAYQTYTSANYQNNVTYPVTTTATIQYPQSNPYQTVPTTYPSDYYNQYNFANNSYQYPDATATSPYNYPAVTTTAYQIPADQSTSKKESSIDLLSGLDFSISQAPLQPQIETKTEPKPETPSPKKTEEKKPDEKKPELIKVTKKKSKVLIKGNPFHKPDTIKLFVQEVDKFEKYVEGLNLKTLSGPSNLELKWKEIQDCQDGVEGAKRSISVARCYPLKNRSPDILPYDYSRVELQTTKDDYINASHLKDVSPYCMDFIVTQNPMQGSLADFWAMIWEQQVECVVCLLSNAELNDEIYWPSELGKEVNVASKSITMLSCVDKENWIERKINIAMMEEKESRIVTVLQNTAWPGSLFPTNPLPFIDFSKRVITYYEQQKCSGSPVLIHCLTGVGRSGICSVLLAVLMELAAIAYPLPDIPSIACKMSCARKNILRDREHLKFVYVALLSYIQTIKREYTKSDTEKAEDNVPLEIAPIDPLSTLDPLWATRKL